MILLPQQELIKHRLKAKFHNNAQHQDTSKPQETKSTPCFSKQDSFRDDSSSPKMESGRTRETNRQDPSLSRTTRNNHVMSLPQDEITGWQSQERGRKERSKDWDDPATVLNRTYERLRKTMIKFGNDYDYPRSPVGVEMAVRELTRTFREFDKKLETNEDNYDSLKRTNDQLTRENAELKKKMSQRTATLEKEHSEQTKKTLQNHKSEKLLMIENHRHEMERLQTAIGLLEKQHRNNVAHIENSTKEEVTRMKTDCDNQIYQSHNSLRLTTERYENALESLRIESEHNRQRIIADNQAARDRITKGFEEEFEEEKVSMKNKLQGLKDHFHEEIRIMQDQHSQELHGKDRAIDEIKTTKEVEERRIEEKYAAERLRREEEHRSLRDDVETLKRALIKRSHFKTMSDRELSLRFQDLATEIDDVSRVRWDNTRESTWPFPDEVLRKLENERRSKQHVIQNTIWVILYERIFCTPFRVLGTEGELIEQDWIEKYGQGEFQGYFTQYV